MNNRKVPLGLLVALPLLLAGCASADATGGAAATTSVAPHSTSPGRSMPGMTSTASAPSSTASAPKSTTSAPKSTTSVDTAGPSEAARMICEPETRENVATLMALQSEAPAKATWADHLYTCTYQLPVGPLVLSVKESPDVQAARSYFNAIQERIGRTKPLTGLEGLGLPAFEDTTGTVVFLKDNMTLQVDASALPPQVGPHQTSRAALAYTVATAVLACWTGE